MPATGDLVTKRANLAMAEKGWTHITPGYLREYDGRVEEFLATYLSARERTRLSSKIVGMFDAITTGELQQSFLKWMKSTLEKHHCGQVEAGRLMGVHHTNVGRWLRGKTDMPLNRFMQFYLLFGGDHESDHPLIPAGDLNLHGYCMVVGYLRQLLNVAEKDHREGRDDLNLWLTMFTLKNENLIPLGISTFLWLNFYFSYLPILTQLDADVYANYKKYVFARGLHDHRYLFSPALPMWNSLDDMNKSLEKWAIPWLLCLKFMAEATGGVSDLFVSATRPARFVHWDGRK
jgi:hypothetical protein